MRLARPFVPYAFLIALIFSVTQGAAQAKGNSLRIDSERRLEPVSIAPRKIQEAETPTPSYFGEERDEKEQAISAPAAKDSDSSWHYDGALTYDCEASPDESSKGNHPGNQIGQKPDLARPPPELGRFVAPKTTGRFVFDPKAGRYRDLTTGRFAAARDLPWPANRGFTSSNPGTLRPGAVVDRFGPATGRFAGQPGATVSQRGLAAGSEALPYTRYEVLKSLPTQVGPAAPVSAFGAEGGATQYLFQSSIADLVEQGFLRALP